MSAFLRQLGSRLQTSSSARLALYGAAAAGTTAVTWKWHAQSRNEQLQRRNAAAARTTSTHTNHDIISPVKEAKHPDETSAEAPIVGTADGAEGEAQEAGNSGAFDPVTGEINWDCPCLGGMAHEADPKGMDCVEKFRDMQECFRDHPDVYAEELADDDDGDIGEDPTSPTTPPPEAPLASGGVGIEIPPPATGEPKPKPSDDDEGDTKVPGGASPPPTPQPKPPITPPPFPPADPQPPIVSDPPANPIPPTIIDPPAGPLGAGGITTQRRNPSRPRPPRE